jgi:2-polyprenyl-6-methoxyphenol hydroxylase-like FAD-dependent oxidoreductase
MRVLISGAGIAGPALAWHLAKAGAQVTIVEKSAALYPHGQNVDITGTALKVVERMNLMGEVRKHNTTEKGTKLVDTNGKHLAYFPLVKGELTPSLTSEFEILRGDLSAILYRATKDLDGVKYVFDTTVESVVENGETEVKVKLSSGDTASFDVLVAADGQWSRVRKQTFPKETLAIRDTDMYAIYWTLPRVADDDDFWTIYPALQSRLLSIRPDPYGSMRACITTVVHGKTEKAAWQAASRGDRKSKEELVRSHFKNAGWQAERILDSMATAPDFYFQAIQQIKLSKWSYGRVVVLGDAGYAPTPLTGMGTSLALTGGYVLGGELSKLQEREHPRKAFQAYEDAYRKFVEEQQWIVPFAPGIFHPWSAWHRWMLTRLIGTIAGVARLVQTTPWLNAKFTPKLEAIPDDFPLPTYTELEPHLAALPVKA